MRGGRGVPRDRANAPASIFGVAAGGTVTKPTGNRSVAAGLRRRASCSTFLPSWVIAVVLPVPDEPDTISPRRAEIWWRLRTIRLRPVVTTLRIVGVATMTELEW